VHVADPGHQSAEGPEPRDEASKEDGLAPVALEELLRAGQAFGCYQDVVASA
jgi:hypothetical protein